MLNTDTVYTDTLCISSKRNLNLSAYEGFADFGHNMCVDIQKRLVYHCGIINHTTNTQYNISEVMKENTVLGMFLSFVCVKREID